jgi:hypothetical protein
MQVGADPVKRSERQEGVTQLQSEVDGLHQGVWAFREMLQGDQGLFKARRRLLVGRACHGPGSRLPAVGQCFVPDLAPQRMVCQTVHLLSKTLGGERFQGGNNASVYGAAPFVQQPPIGHLMRQGVLEGIGLFWEEARLIEKLGGLEVREAAVHGICGHLGNGL